jgi:dynein heavy chain
MSQIVSIGEKVKQ